MGQLHTAVAGQPGAAGAGAGRRLYQMLRRQMDDGTLPVGARVPSTRALAAEFGMSRTTVTTVYEQLAAEGFIVTSAGRVARVTGQPGPAAAPQPGRRVRSAPSLSAFGQRVEKM